MAGIINYFTGMIWGPSQQPVEDQKISLNSENFEEIQPEKLGAKLLVSKINILENSYRGFQKGPSLSPTRVSKIEEKKEELEEKSSPNIEEKKVKEEEAIPLKKESSLSTEDRIAILKKVSPPNAHKEQMIHAFSSHYPGITLGEKLGEGSSSIAHLFTYQDKEGKSHQKVLKLTNFEETSKLDAANKQNGLSEKRMGGEWFALLDLGEHVVTTEKALAFDHVKKGFVLIDASTVQKMFQNKEERRGVELTFIGSVSEYLPRSKDLEEGISLLHQCKGMEVNLIRHVAKQILQGTAHIHKTSVQNKFLVHRDIKPANILVDVAGNVKLIDLGFARIMSKKNKRRSKLGTLLYMAPEMFFNSGYNQKVDSYAIGATLFAMVTNQSLSNANTNHQFVMYHLEKKPDVAKDYRLQGVNSNLRDLIGKLCHHNPTQRLSPEEALKHPFFT